MKEFKHDLFRAVSIGFALGIGAAVFVNTFLIIMMMLNYIQSGGR